jgi:hypothetical protein
VILKYNFFSLVCIFFISIGVLNGAQRTGLFNNISGDIKYLDFIKLIGNDKSRSLPIYKNLAKQSEEDCEKLRCILEKYKGIINMNLLKKYIDQDQIKKIFCNQSRMSGYYIGFFKDINSKRITPCFDIFTKMLKTEINEINNRIIKSDKDDFSFVTKVVGFICRLKLDYEIVLPYELINIFKQYLLLIFSIKNEKYNKLYYQIKKCYLRLIKYNMMDELNKVITSDIQSKDVKSEFNKILNSFDQYFIDENKKEDCSICLLECIIDQMALNTISTKSIFLTRHMEEYINALTHDFKVKEIKDYFYMSRVKIIGEECESLIQNKEKLPNLFIDNFKKYLELQHNKIVSQEEKNEIHKSFITLYNIECQNYLRFILYDMVYDMVYDIEYEKKLIDRDKLTELFEKIRINEIDKFFLSQNKNKDWGLLLLNFIEMQMKLNIISIESIFFEAKIEEYIGKLISDSMVAQEEEKTDMTRIKELQDLSYHQQSIIIHEQLVFKLKNKYNNLLSDEYINILKKYLILNNHKIGKILKKKIMIHYNIEEEEEEFRDDDLFTEKHYEALFIEKNYGVLSRNYLEFIKHNMHIKLHSIINSFEIDNKCIGELIQLIQNEYDKYLLCFWKNDEIKSFEQSLLDLINLSKELIISESNLSLLKKIFCIKMQRNNQDDSLVIRYSVELKDIINNFESLNESSFESKIHSLMSFYKIAQQELLEIINDTVYKFYERKNLIVPYIFIKLMDQYNSFLDKKSDEISNSILILSKYNIRHELDKIIEGFDQKQFDVGMALNDLSNKITGICKIEKSQFEKILLEQILVILDKNVIPKMFYEKTFLEHIEQIGKAEDRELQMNVKKILQKINFKKKIVFIITAVLGGSLFFLCLKKYIYKYFYFENKDISNIKIIKP